MKRAVAALVVLAGCGIGSESALVGIWRPRHVVETSVCIRTENAACAQSSEVSHEEPGRRFGGFMVEWFHPGYLHASGLPELTSGFAIDSNIEYLRGHGGLGLGLRAGANIGGGASGMLFYMPINVLAHYGHAGWSLYAGPGYTPYLSYSVKNSDVDRTSHGLNAMAGARVLLRQNRFSRLTASIDVQQQLLFHDIRATSVTAGIGVHL